MLPAVRGGEVNFFMATTPFLFLSFTLPSILNLLSSIVLTWFIALIHH